MMKRTKAFSLIELLVVIAIIVLLISLLLPILGGARKQAKRTQDSSQIRSMTQATIAAAAGSDSRYIGMDGRDFDGDGFTDVDMNRDGNPDANGDQVEARMWLLAARNHVTGGLLISPFETKVVWTTGPMSIENYSYAALDLDDGAGGGPGGRAVEWKSTANSRAVIYSGRNLGPVDANAMQVRGISSTQAGEWIDSVAFNDAHVERKTTPVVLTKYGVHKFTRYLSGYAGFRVDTLGDYLFGEKDRSDAPGNVAGFDADMIHQGDETNGETP